MPTTTIKCSNVETQDNGSLKVGYYNEGTWENYYIGDDHPELFSYFTKGARVTIEYDPKKSRAGKPYGVVTGVSGAASESPVPVDDAGRQKSIELQVAVKAWAQVMAGKDVTPAEFAADVARIWTDVFGDPLGAMKQKAAESLDAEDEDDFPFD